MANTYYSMAMENMSPRALYAVSMEESTVPHPLTQLHVYYPLPLASCVLFPPSFTLTLEVFGRKVGISKKGV